MALTLQVPLARNEAGDLQVEGTRVFLEDILEAYERGLSPEEVVAYRKRQEARAREGVNPFAKGKPPGSRPGAWRPRPQGLAYQGPQ